ncbi:MULTISPECIES: NUDIX domain-containing protein [Bacillaceae]|uniref:NUDIX domain-containing protein n=1 Tax=Bacillaceae TaxID=186817 RepID=UPI001C570DDA|nr:NUDIX domain-containing protein [Rossellomorea sp. YZS02]MBW3112642.1 NUDIX domain-containing protein [Bacillus sp. MCCB 382]MDX8344649.1 NUDIX domain-containing protein [Rossellomorea sp. YZS02]
MKVIFGDRIQGLDYQRRKGVYAVIFHHENDKVMTVRNESGHYFLPGGGIEESENQVDCLRRELIEETGYLVSIDSYIGNAMNYFHSRKGEPLLSDAYFYLVELKAKVQEQCDHVTEWVDVEDVKRLLFHEHYDWAVTEAKLIVNRI